MNNYAAICYVIIAMKQAGFKEQDINEVIYHLYDVFDSVTEKEAEAISFDEI